MKKDETQIIDDLKKRNTFLEKELKESFESLLRTLEVWHKIANRQGKEINLLKSKLFALQFDYLRILDELLPQTSPNPLPKEFELNDL